MGFFFDYRGYIIVGSILLVGIIFFGYTLIKMVRDGTTTTAYPILRRLNKK